MRYFSSKTAANQRGSASAWDFFGNTYANEIKHTGGGIKPIVNGIAGGVTLGYWRPFKYGYNPNDAYLSNGMKKFRSGALGVAEGAIGLATPFGVTKGVGALARTAKPGTLLHKTLKARQGFNKWLVRPGSNWASKTIKAPLRMARLEFNEARALANTPLTVKGLKQIPARLFTTRGLGKPAGANTGWITKALGGWAAYDQIVGKPQRLADDIHNRTRILNGDLTPDEIKALGITNFNRINSEARHAGKPWYEYYEANDQDVLNLLREKGMYV